MVIDSAKVAMHRTTRKALLAERPGYSSWDDMKQRCFNPKRKQYKYYGGRGITVDPRWLGEGGFERFWQDMGPRPAGMTLDRKDVNGDYSPENCRWASRRTQANNKRNNILITIGDETKTLTEWAAANGIGRAHAWLRIYRYGWDPVRAVTEPPIRGRNQHGSETRMSHDRAVVRSAK
jgi:hypothetical protein